MIGVDVLTMLMAGGGVTFGPLGPPVSPTATGDPVVLDWTAGDPDATTLIKRNGIELDEIAAGIETYATGLSGGTYTLAHRKDGILTDEVTAT